MAKQIIKKEEMVAIRNAITNEVENAKVTMIITKDLPKYKEPFTIFFQATNYALIREIKPITAKLLLYLISVVEYENQINKTIDELAEYLNYTRRNVEIGIKQLCDLNVIKKVKHPQDKRSFLMFINPYQSWKGKKKGRDKVVSQNQLELPFMPKQKELITPNTDFDKTK